MRYSLYYIPTLKEAPKEAELLSHKLLLRGGFIRKLSSGIYTFLPLAMRVLDKITKIIREEMNRAGAIEVLLPAVQPSELWMKSKRWFYYGDELLRFKDRKGGEFCFGPTHEEVIVDLVQRDVCSYRQLPLNLYQIQVKFRDELRPRGGLLRGREFIMKDAYSFDIDEKGAKISYEKMFNAYRRIFKRCGFNFNIVEADTGNIGGSLSHEFQVPADEGEDIIVSCSRCGYNANHTKAEVAPPECNKNYEMEEKKMEKVYTPQVKTVEDVSSFLCVEPSKIVKTLIYLVDKKPVAILIRGDRELNEVKLKNLLCADEIEMAGEKTIFEITNAPVGFTGPLNLKIKFLSDHSLMGLQNFVVGANEEDMHYINVNIPRDINPEKYYDLSFAKEGDRCPKCGGEYKLTRGIELGHIFYLGTKYSEPMGCTFLNENGVEKPIVMGCYGIGVTRIMQTCAEVRNDERGIIWSIPLSPFQIILISLNTDDPYVVNISEEIYNQLLNKNIEILIDDRDERPGVKLNDADLIGIPIQIIVGKKSIDKGGVEIRHRGGDFAPFIVPFDEVEKNIEKILKEEWEKYDVE